MNVDHIDISSILSCWEQIVFFFSAIDYKTNSKMSKFNINDINYTHLEQVSYHEKMTHL